MKLKAVLKDATGQDTSLPVRGAWIEMAIPTICITPNAVAPRAGSVD